MPTGTDDTISVMALAKYKIMDAPTIKSIFHMVN